MDNDARMWQEIEREEDARQEAIRRIDREGGRILDLKAVDRLAKEIMEERGH